MTRESRAQTYPRLKIVSEQNRGMGRYRQLASSKPVLLVLLFSESADVTELLTNNEH